MSNGAHSLTHLWVPVTLDKERERVEKREREMQL